MTPRPGRSTPTGPGVPRRAGRRRGRCRTPPPRRPARRGYARRGPWGRAGEGRGALAEVGQRLLGRGRVRVPHRLPARIADQVPEPVGPTALAPGQLVGLGPQRASEVVELRLIQAPYPVHRDTPVEQRV